MRNFYFLLTLIFTVINFTSISQNIAINNSGAQPDSSSILDIQSNNKGLLIPRMTDSQRIAIHTPATGLLVYQINGTVGFYFNSGSPSVPNWLLLAKDNVPPIVISGSDTTINLNNPTDSIRLAGSATDKDGSVRSYLWSEVSGPNTPVFSAAGSASTVVKEVISGTYIFQLMATDNNGATGVKSMSVTVIAPQITNIILQPNQNPNEVHLAVNYLGNSSDKTAPEFGATAWTNQGSMALTRGIFKFDLSSIPPGATILSAKLTL
ncbi:MAG: domain containing protein [Segetibacter sp.]|nr:domain containing protein [Segetibacter sp.]